MSRRSKHEGTVERHGSGYRGKVMIDGTTYRVTGKSEREVRRLLRNLVSDAERGILPAPDKLMVREHLEHWLDTVVKVNLRPATYRDYSNTVFNHAIPAFGTVRLAKLQPAHLDELYVAMRMTGLSTKTIRNVHGTIHSALEHALKRGLVVRNVADAVELPKYDRPEITPLTGEQVRRLRAAIAGNRWEALITLAIATGMRQSELLGLKWTDINMDTRRVSVSRQLDRSGALSPTKTAKGRRMVDLPPFAAEALKSHRLRQIEQKLEAGPSWEGRTEYEGLVFTTHEGRPLIHRNVFRDFKKLLQVAGVPPVSFHNLRHTAATLLLEQGVAGKVVSERLGHSQVGVTMDLYSHVTPGMGQDAARKLQDLLG